MESWPITRLDDYIDDFKDGKTDYFDQLSMIADIYFTPNIGGLARPDFQVKASLGYAYRFCPESDEKSGEFLFGISLVNFAFGK